MIELSNVSKRYRTRLGGEVTVLDRIDLTIEPSQKVGILGGNGAGKSTLIRLISGVELASSGTVRRKMTTSWPLAFSGAFQGSLTGLDNLRFVCRVYGVDYEPLKPFVEEFSELGQFIREPVKHYSAGMRARLAFALSMAIDFDCYLIDEVLAVGDARFQAKCEHELFEKRKSKAMLMVSHSPDMIRSHCKTVYVLRKGHIVKFEDMDEAYDYYAKAHGEH